jgi:(p)ppGpp synthase/HD superfamily hydrolase
VGTDCKSALSGLKEITTDFAIESKGEAGFRDGLKSKDRALEKIEGDYAGDTSRLVDIAGSKVVYETVGDLYKGLEKFNKEYKILKIKDRIQEPLNGYRDILMNIEAKNGHIVEFRLHLREMDEIAEGVGHKLYEQQRSLDAILTTRFLTKAEKDLYKELVSKQNKLYEETWNKIINK